MTDALVPEPGPRELPGLDSWWDGSQWRRIEEPVANPAHGQTVPNPWDTPPAQHLTYGRPVDNPGYGVPLADPATFPRPALPLALVPQGYATPPRRSRINSALWTVAIIGTALVVNSLAETKSPRETESSQRTFVDIPVVEPAGAAGALPLESAEAFAATYELHPDTRGSYVASGQEITRAFGAELVWSDFDTPDPSEHCTRDVDRPVKPTAWYCSAEPYLIRLNSTSPWMPALLYTPGFIDDVKHELAHLIIHERCGRSEPNVGTVEEEGVTSSYAVLFLGADRDFLGDVGPDNGEYAMTHTTDEVAMWIHEGLCWYTADGA